MPYYEVVLGRYASIGVKAETLQEAVRIAKECDDMEYYEVSDVEVISAEKVEDFDAQNYTDKIINK